MRKLLKEALRKWNQFGSLATSELCRRLGVLIKEKCIELQLNNDPVASGKALQAVLQMAIESLGVVRAAPLMKEDDPRWKDEKLRHHNILVLHCTRMGKQQIAERIGLAIGGRFEEVVNNAYNELEEVLLRMLQNRVESQTGSNLAPDEWHAPIGPLWVNDPRYVVRQADNQLVLSVNNVGHTYIIRGPSRVGKTSLMKRAINKLQEQCAVQYINFDFQEVNPEYLLALDALMRQIAFFITQKICPTIDFHSFWEAQNLAPAIKIHILFEQYVLPAVDGAIVLALDEVDRLLTTDYREEFYSIVRAWHNNRADNELWRKLHLIMAISTSPYLLIQDVNLSPFNVGTKIELDDLNESQIIQLSQLYAVSLSDNEAPNMANLLGGHPFLISNALYALQQQAVSWDKLKSRLTTIVPIEEHLRDLLQCLRNDRNLSNAFRQIVAGDTCDDEQTEFRLLKAGLIKNVQGRYVCRDRKSVV